MYHSIVNYRQPLVSSRPPPPVLAEGVRELGGGYEVMVTLLGEEGVLPSSERERERKGEEEFLLSVKLGSRERDRVVAIQ